MKVAIHQPHYLPWPGYLRKWAAADVFVFLDTVQYERGGYHNRVKLGDGKWLTVPVKHAPLGTALYHMRVDNSTPWQENHRGRIVAQYGSRLPDWLEILFCEDHPLLSPVAAESCGGLAEAFGIKNECLYASELPVLDIDPTGRLVAICQAVGADTYLAGPGACAYLDLAQFERAGIAVEIREWGTPDEDHSALHTLLTKGPVL